MRSNDEIIDLLNQLREEKNLSISELARRVGMAKSAFCYQKYTSWQIAASARIAKDTD